MPQQAKKPCRKCGKATSKTYCQDCTTPQGKWHGMYNRKWQKARTLFLKRNPLCVACEQEGYTRLANVVDHIVDHKGNLAIFWDQTNWQSLCTYCHNKKTGGR